MALIGSRTSAITASASLTDGTRIAPGTTWRDERTGQTFLQVSAASTITKYDVVWVDQNYTATSITPALTITAGRVGVAHDHAFAAGDNGRVVVDGPCTINVLGSCAKNVPLFTTDTAGSLDDATASASHRNIIGLYITTTVGSTATSQTAILGNIAIRHTLVYP